MLHDMLYKHDFKPSSEKLTVRKEVNIKQVATK